MGRCRDITFFSFAAKRADSQAIGRVGIRGAGHGNGKRLATLAPDLRLRHARPHSIGLRVAVSEDEI